jgi:hypothetical protein
MVNGTKTTFMVRCARQGMAVFQSKEATDNSDSAINLSDRGVLWQQMMRRKSMP